MNKVFHRIFSLVLAISLLFCISAVQAENTEYPLEVHVDMAELTVRLPSSAIYVTQDSTVNDLYFQIAGADSYDAVMADLTTNSVYFDGIDMGYSWEIRIAVQPGAPFSLKGSNQAFIWMQSSLILPIGVSRLTIPLSANPMITLSLPSAPIWVDGTCTPS